MDNMTTAMPAAAQPAEAEERKDGATALGKFKDVDALLAAYNNLEAEFTRRSQRLRELEKVKADAPPAQASSGEAAQNQSGGDAPAPAEECSEQLKAKIIAEYLASAAKNTGVPLMTGVGRPPSKGSVEIAVVALPLKKLELLPLLQLLRIGERDAVHALQRVVARIAQPVARAVLHNGKALHESS